VQGKISSYLELGRKELHQAVRVLLIRSVRELRYSTSALVVFLLFPSLLTQERWCFATRYPGLEPSTKIPPKFSVYILDCYSSFLSKMTKNASVDQVVGKRNFLSCQVFNNLSFKHDWTTLEK
jgi:hypothetical protein